MAFQYPGSMPSGPVAGGGVGFGMPGGFSPLGARYPLLEINKRIQEDPPRLCAVYIDVVGSYSFVFQTPSRRYEVAFDQRRPVPAKNRGRRLIHMVVTPCNDTAVAQGAAGTSAPRVEKKTVVDFTQSLAQMPVTALGFAAQRCPEETGRHCASVILHTSRHAPEAGTYQIMVSPLGMLVDARVQATARLNVLETFQPPPSTPSNRYSSDGSAVSRRHRRRHRRRRHHRHARSRRHASSEEEGHGERKGSRIRHPRREKTANDTATFVPEKSQAGSPRSSVSRFIRPSEPEAGGAPPLPWPTPAPTPTPSTVYGVPTTAEHPDASSEESESDAETRSVESSDGESNRSAGSAGGVLSRSSNSNDDDSDDDDDGSGSTAGSGPDVDSNDTDSGSDSV